MAEKEKKPQEGRRRPPDGGRLGGRRPEEGGEGRPLPRRRSDRPLRGGEDRAAAAARGRGEGREPRPPRRRRIRIRQIRSGICTPVDQKQALKGLGLRRIRHEVVRPDTPAIRGQILKVRHLVEVVGE